jgi:threonine dehydrogenase-like Zn-dependent dehydrogenase
MGTYRDRRIIKSYERQFVRKRENGDGKTPMETLLENLSFKIMLAIILEKQRLIKIKQTLPPTPSSFEVLMEVKYSGICRTDAKMWEMGHRDLVLPRILGHEFCGKINGKYYVAWPGVCCGKCEYCREHRENLCDNIQIIGFHKHGGFAEFVSVPKNCLIPVPDEVPLDIATFAEPIGCCINAISRIKGKSLLILGAGTMGVLLGLCAKEKGLNVYLYDIDKKRLDLSKEIQKELGIVPIKEMKKSFDAVINATSTYSGFEQALSHIKKGGMFCFFSGISNKNRVDAKIINELHYREIHLLGSYGCTKKHMEVALDLIKKRQNIVSKLIDRYIHPEEVEQAFRDILNKKSFKIIIDWNF